MRNVQDILDEAARAAGHVALPDDRYHRLLRRRDRKRRNERIAAATLALVLTVAAVAGVVRAFNTKTVSPATPSHGRGWGETGGRSPTPRSPM